MSGEDFDSKLNPATSESAETIDKTNSQQTIDGEVPPQVLAQMQKLQKELGADPKSLCFIQLGDLYLALNMIDAAHDLVSKSLKIHPNSVSGLILMGRIFKHKRNYNEAIQLFDVAIKRAPTNWYGLLLRAETHLKNNSPKLALKDFKSVLLHNPTHSFSRKAVAKLEILTADDFGEDVFEMRSLKALSDTTAIQNQEPIGSEPEPQIDDEFWRPVPPKLERLLALVDAFTVRHEYSKALTLIQDCQAEFGDHGEIRTRRLRLKPFETAEKLLPKDNPDKSRMRQHASSERQLAALELLLKRIQRMRPPEQVKT